MTLIACLGIATALCSVTNMDKENSPLPPNLLPGPAKMPSGLFVGTCYQPIDRTPEQIVQDIAIMRDAGFNVVRMGDLSWDSFEPSQGRFEFEWFDKILDQMHAAGIRVVLDIPGLPAPIWLHRKSTRTASASHRRNGTWTISATRITLAKRRSWPRR
jgi:beta-galactosidase